MIKINKNSCPDELRKYAESAPLDPSEPFDDSKVKRIVRNSLLQEQHYLCAYCMTPIGVNIPVIEHIYPKDTYTSRARDYFNLLCSCSYDDQKLPKNEQHCDLCKDDTTLKILPSMIFSSIEDFIFYKNDGTIFSSNSDLFYDINTILNLNATPYLKRNRQEAARNVDQFVFRMTKKNYSNLKIKRLLLSFLSAEEQKCKYLPYFGVIKKRCEFFIKKTE